MFTHGETITVHPYGVKRDEHGNIIRDAHGNIIIGFGADVPVFGVGVDALADTSEPTEPGRNAVIVGYTIFAPFDVPVGPKDEVTVRGVRCTVQGDPNAGRVRNPFTGWEPGCEFAVQRIEG